MTSTFGVRGSVNRRNFVPVIVWKHVNRNFSVSRISRPVLGRPGFGREECPELDGTGVVEAAPDVLAVVTCEWGMYGVRERVMAWILHGTQKC